jgi:methylenetetrahydrofolate reductase (NADPH)
MMLRHTAEELRLVQRIRYELFPTKKSFDVTKHLPPNSCVSVTSSAKHGVEETKAMCMQLLAQGHRVCPHFAARSIDGPSETKQLARWTRENCIKKVFIVGGDAHVEKHYPDSAVFLRDFLEADSGVKHISFAIYPEGHQLVNNSNLLKFALDKDRIIRDGGIESEAVTQICFDSFRMVTYLKELRAEGFQAPVYVGIPGIVSIAKLLSFGSSIGIASALRFLSQNVKIATALLSPSSAYDPSTLISELASANQKSREGAGDNAMSIGIEGVHSFTFNATESTAAWVNKYTGMSP